VIIECNNCKARYRYDESRFEGKPSKKVRCTKCQTVFEVFSADERQEAPRPMQTLKPDDTMTSRSASPASESLPGEGEKPTAEMTRKNRLSTAERRQVMTELKLPEDSKLSLAVISGPQSGKIFQIEKPKMVIGRQDADITVEDPEISRQHAAIEVAGDRVTLIDLGSTNGVFMGDEQISEAPLENQSEFSVGSSTLMLIVTRRGT
jgi:predicted Zn finger-like uncharacterized protein